MKNIISAPANMSAHISEVLLGEYDIPELKFEKPPVILDLGANVGAFAIWASERFPGATIRCYEPHPGNFELLHKNIPDTCPVNCFQVAVSDERGDLFLHDGKFNCGESSLTDVRASAKSGRPVTVISGADLAPADIIKLDTEGSEWEILSTYPHLDKVTAIMFEWHRPEDREKISELLSNHGFTCVADNRTKYVDRGVQKWAKGLPGRQGVPAQDVNLLIACPCYGGQLYASHATSVMALILELKNKQVRHTLEYLPNESLIPRARNRFGTMCLLGDSLGVPFTHLLFLDVDIGFKAIDIISLIALDKDIVALPYSAKDFDFQKIVKAVKAGVTDGETLKRCAGRPIINATEKTSFSVTEAVQFPQLGTGILLIKRKVFEKMAESDSLATMGAADFERSDEWLSYKHSLGGLLDHRDFAEQYAKFLSAHPRRKYKLMTNENARELGSEFAYDFFRIGVDPDTNYYNSEDYQFCLDARKLGFETWLWPNGVTTHTGPYCFTMDIPTQAALGIDLTANPEEDLVAK